MAPEQFANRSQLNFEAAFEMAVDCDHPVQVRNFHVVAEVPAFSVWTGARL
jgi:hypothetical protein